MAGLRWVIRAAESSAALLNYRMGGDALATFVATGGTPTGRVLLDCRPKDVVLFEPTPGPVAVCNGKGRVGIAIGQIRTYRDTSSEYFRADAVANRIAISVCENTYVRQRGIGTGDDAIAVGV